MDYNGTEGDDIIDAIALKLPAWTTIYGRGGNDRITFGDGNVIGGAGNDTLIGTTAYSTAAYWGSSSGVVVNLATGVAQDGLGGIDSLINIHQVQGTGFNDLMTGSSADDGFYGGGGNDTIIGGGGQDMVSYYFVKSSAVTISYDAPSDTFIVRKNFANDKGVDTLTGIASISFTGEGSDGKVINKANFVAQGGYLRMSQTTTLSYPAGAWPTQFKTGDFNGDGKADVLVVTQIGPGSALAPSYVLLGDGAGHFSDGTVSVFVKPPMAIIGGGRTAVGDFNHDGISDIFQLDFGIDSAPFPGGMNHHYLSNPVTHKLEDASATLSQANQQNHSLSIGDVNGDGYLDVLVNTLSGTGNALYLNDGTGHFMLRNELIPHPRSGNAFQNYTSSGMVDMNGDGALDLVLGRWDGGVSTQTSVVLINDGKGDFTHSTPVVLPASAIPLETILDVKSIDLNGDQWPDLMLSITHGGGSADSHDDAYYNTGYIQLLVNQAGKSYVDETAARMPAEILNNVGKGWFISLSAVDMDKDGYMDILAVGAGGAATSMLLTNRGDGTFYTSWRSVGGGATVAADVNQDGWLDLITQAGTTTYTDLNTQSQGQTVVGSNAADTLDGSNVNDTLVGGQGNDRIDGHGGSDTVCFTDALAHYTVRQLNDLTTVTAKTGTDGTDTLSNVETLQFADMSIHLAMKAKAAALPAASVKGVVELYVAFFNRMPDADGLAYWLDQIKGGKSLADVSQTFYTIGASAQYSALTGFSTSMGNADFINVFYKNVLGRADGADAGGMKYWSDKLLAGTSSRWSLAQDILASAHTYKGDKTLGYVADLLDDKFALGKTLAIDFGLSYNADAYTHGIDIARTLVQSGTVAALALVGIAPADIALA